MSRNRTINDPRWEGVEVASLWKVVCRETDPEADRIEVYKEATTAVVETGRWREWEAVMRPGGQITGFRRLRAGDWFTMEIETGEVAGPFTTKRLALATIREKSASKIEAGVYEAGGHRIFTREAAKAATGKEVD